MITASASQPPPVPLIKPYGGALVNLLVEDATRRQELLREAETLPSIVLSPRSVCDLELLTTGALSPLDRFMGQEDYENVLANMRLKSGSVFPVPVTLNSDGFAHQYLGKRVALRSAHGQPLAVMEIEETYEWELKEEACRVLGTDDRSHPLVDEMRLWGPLNLSGPLEVVDLPRYWDFPEYRLTPRQVRTKLCSFGAVPVVAFQSRNPMHRAHEEIVRRAAAQVEGAVLLHPAVGLTNPGDVDYVTRVRTYVAVARQYFDPARSLLALLPLAMRMAGPREALWHAIIRRNYGASHFIVGRDHASPGGDARGRPFYAADAAQDLVRRFEAEIGVKAITPSELVYVPSRRKYVPKADLQPGTPTLSLSGTELRTEYVKRGRKLPRWYARPEVSDILARSHQAMPRSGYCVWLTGVPCAGKTSIAEALANRSTAGGREVTVLDGDMVRAMLSKGLGFSRSDRIANNLRIAFLAMQIVRHGGIAICAAVSPFAEARRLAELMIGPERFVLVHVHAPQTVCEARDVKGLYEMARRGQLKDFTAIDSPYEAPTDPDVMVDTSILSIEKAADEVVRVCLALGHQLSAPSGDEERVPSAI